MVCMVSATLSYLVIFSPVSIVYSGPDSVPNDSTKVLIGAEPHTLGPEDAKAAVLMVHGFLGAGQNFDNLPDLLAEEGFRVRVMLLPGHGTSPYDLKTVSASTLKQAVFEEIQSLKAHYEAVYVIGHSMGATLAFIAASKISIDGLVLAAPFFAVTRKPYYLFPPETWFRYLHPIFPWLYKGKLFLQVNRREAKDKILSYDWVPANALLVLFELGREAEQKETISSINCPTLMIHSVADAAASFEHAKLVYDMLPAAKKDLLVLQRSDHHVFYDYEDKQVKQEIIIWLKYVQNLKKNDSKK
mgnify:CR=1 FL=1